jgi:hypothetical protein
VGDSYERLKKQVDDILAKKAKRLAKIITDEVYSYYTNMPGYEQDEIEDLPTYGVILTLVQQGIKKAEAEHIIPN